MTDTAASLLERQFARFAQLHAELPPPRARDDYPGVTSYYDLTYAEVVGVRPLVLDLHIPSGDGPHPVLVWVHGGGWRGGSRAMGHAVKLAQHGYAVAAPQYRLSGEAKFPAQVHDLKGALRWLRAHAQTFRLDPDHIAGWGASAGGFLVSLLALTGGDAEWEGNVGGNLDESSHLQAAVTYFAVSDLLAMASPTGDTLADQMATDLLGYTVRQRPGAARQASPIGNIRQDAPPFLLLHGDADPMVPHAQSQSLHDALSAAGAQSTLINVPGAIHEDAAFWNERTLSEVRAFLDRTLVPTKRA
jgi:acetyl esterase/lipase